MKIDEAKNRAVEKVLKEPVSAGFSDQAWKIRTNLIVASSIALVLGLADVRIAPESSFLGLRFTGLSDMLIRFTLAGVIIYLLAHFLWAGVDSFLEWRLRITGTRAAFQTGSFFSPPHVDHPVDPRQSTLYNWWSERNVYIAKIAELLDDIPVKMRTWEADIEAIRKGKTDPYSQNLSNVIHGLSEVNNQCAQLSAALKASTEAATDERIPVSLKRFDGWFQLFLRSQNLRWFVIEFGAPVVFSAAALYALLR